MPVALFGQATLTSPAPGSTLAGTSVSFTWTAGTGTTRYDLWLGLNGPGSSSLYTTGWLTTTSTTVPSLPTKGATVYARLYSDGSEGEQYNDYIFTEPTSISAALISPTAGSVLGASNQMFTWTAGTAVTEYALWLGLSPGSYNLYATGWLTTTSITVPILAAKGATVYARLYSDGSGGEQYNDYIFTEPTSIPAALISPTAGSVLGASNLMFTWTAGTAVTGYDLYLGLSGPGSSSLYTSGWLTTTSATVPRLPAKGTTVYARLYSDGSGGEQYNDYTYTEAGGALLSAFSCTSVSLTGAGTDACTVTLNAAAPSGGLAVSLSSSSLAATVPATVTVPANATSVGFMTTVSSVGTAQPVTLTAVGGGVSETVALQLNPDLPTLSVATSASPSTYGGALTFTATISTDPTGFVTFDSNGVSIGTGTINGTTATLTTSSLTAGPHTITALWAGNSTYGAATSGALNQVVNKAAPPVSWNTPAGVAYGTALTSVQLDATSTVAGTFGYSPAAGTVLVSGSQTLSVTFTPTDTTDYNTAVARVALTVNKATPTITWATPAGITYGTGLSASQLDATSSVAGTFVYSPGAGTVLVSGSQMLSVTFTPTDTTDYNTASATVALTVNKAMATINWAAPAGITYGTALSASQLNATASVAGTFVYSPAAGTVLVSGSQTLSVTFTPTDTTDNNTATATVALTVNKALPTITWATPGAITSGTALTSTQLDATASVPGSFAYSPAAGSVLAAGAQTLTVIFTPTDAVDYSTASVSVTLTVNQGISMLSINATSVGFGNVALNQPATQTLTLSSTGTSSVTVNSAVLVGAGFTLSGTALPTTLAPGQTATAGVQFDPTVVGAATGTLTISSTSSSNPTATIAITGTGTAVSYAVDLSWDAPVDSTDPVAGYNIYRSPGGSSTYQLLNSSVEALTAYVDSTVQNGTSYDYIVESVDSSGVESVPTSPVALTIP
ncbi:MAG TPA: choice-of-anchor D domain-containing protein [Terracidiphilus sp.]|nr:choice-of-anchor D domain-containing protein [Terracidiphilus sp.]